jgi:hypothetical protein
MNFAHDVALRPPHTDDLLKRSPSRDHPCQAAVRRKQASAEPLKVAFLVGEFPHGNYLSTSLGGEGEFNDPPDARACAKELVIVVCSRQLTSFTERSVAFANCLNLVCLGRSQPDKGRQRDDRFWRSLTIGAAQGKAVGNAPLAAGARRDEVSACPDWAGKPRPPRRSPPSGSARS